MKSFINTLRLLVVKWDAEKGLLLEDTKLHTTNRKRWKVIEKDGKKLIWDWGHPMRMDCITCRPMEYISKKMILWIDMTYPNEYREIAKGNEKI